MSFRILRRLSANLETLTMTPTNFIRQVHASGDFAHITVRGRQLADDYRTWGVRELRTRKHNHLAVAWDDLGNATILTADGRVLQLIGDECKTLPH